MNDMVQSAVISVRGTQYPDGCEPETMELVTEGSYCYEPGFVNISYAETQITGLEGVITRFTVEGDTVTLSRTGKLNSTMVFRKGTKHESLYDVGMGALLVGVQTQSVTTLMNEHGGMLNLEYEVSVENQPCGFHAYHIDVRTS